MLNAKKKTVRKPGCINEERKQNILSQRNVKRANRLTDPLSGLFTFIDYDRNGIKVKLECKKVRDLDPKTIDLLFKLVKKNMETLYQNCDWGWDDQKKYSQMTEPAAWYLIARDEKNAPVAFSHFRFDMDYGLDVLYVYELQIDESVRRKGLGKFMSQALEVMAYKHKLKKVILTCFKHNADAIKFYESMKFNIDNTSPEDTEEEQYCYYILSKPNKNLLDLES